jgi:hypothetical protein
MRPLSATEAISPAIEHTKALLRPFSLRLWLKLGLVAVFAEMGGQFFSPPISNYSQHHFQPAYPSGIGAFAGGVTPMLVGVIVAGVVLGLLIFLALFFLGSRLQLVLLDLVATRTTLVAPAWHRTAFGTWRWIGIKLVSFLVLFAALGAIFAFPIILFIRSMPAGNAQPSAGFFGSIFLFIFAIFVLVLVLVTATWILRDFVMPFMLFENASFGDSFGKATALIRNEPGAVLFYLFMKFVVCFVAGIATELCIGVGALIALIPTGLVGGILWFALHNSGPLGKVIMYIGFGVLGVIFLVALFAAILCLGGAVLIFYQAYALYFIGGRIPQIGNLLEPPPPPYYPPPMPLPQVG